MLPPKVWGGEQGRRRGASRCSLNTMWTVAYSISMKDPRGKQTPPKWDHPPLQEAQCACVCPPAEGRCSVLFTSTLQPGLAAQVGSFFTFLDEVSSTGKQSLDDAYSS